MGLLSKSGIVDFRIFAMGEVAQAWPTHKAISYQACARMGKLPALLLLNL